MEHNSPPPPPPTAADPTFSGPSLQEPTSEHPAATWVQHLFVPDAPSAPPEVPTSSLLAPSLPHPTELEIAEADVRRLQAALAAAQNRLHGLRRRSRQGEAALQCKPASSPPALRPVSPGAHGPIGPWAESSKYVPIHCISIYFILYCILHIFLHIIPYIKQTA